MDERSVIVAGAKEFSREARKICVRKEAIVIVSVAQMVRGIPSRRGSVAQRPHYG